MEIILDHADNNPKTYYIIFILDMSGSMQNTSSETIKGFNKFLKEQKSLDNKAFFKLVLFNEKCFEKNFVDIKDTKRLTVKTYVPEGNTALLDTIGKSINDLSNYLSDKNDYKCLMCILTDGLENCSVKFNRNQISSLIKQKQEFGWEFVFLGANQDAFAEGHSLSIKSCSTMTYDINDSKKYELMWESVSDNLTSYVNNSVPNFAFSPDDYKKQSDNIDKFNIDKLLTKDFCINK